MFVQQSNKDRLDRENEEKRLIREKKDREEREQALDNEIQALNSEIEKNKDALLQHNELKSFMLELSDPHFNKVASEQ